MDSKNIKKFVSEASELGENLSKYLVSDRTKEIQNNVLISSVIGISLSLGIFAITSV